MIGSIVGSGLKLGASIFGGIKQAQAYKQVQNSLKQQQSDNQAWYDRRYNEDATQRADAQAVLKQVMDSIRARNKQAAGGSAVMGGTNESVAASKEANAQALADAASQIAVAGANRKDQIENQYLDNKSKLQGQIDDMKLKKAQGIAEVVKGAADAGADIAGLF